MSKITRGRNAYFSKHDFFGDSKAGQFSFGAIGEESTGLLAPRQD
ncbi:MAG: hypothetical protein ABSA83_00670 [Verrucomicrobiota bacterium]